ncbi:hypothetical protein [Streptomyces platensis]|uniref:hypothetical protein n=1 Tax=Streptomyces platensis TaxID=58346 RepID=UPI003F4CDEE2
MLTRMAERRKAAVPCSAIRSVTRRPVISAAGSGMAVGAAQRSEEGVTSAGAARVMVAACRAAGLDERGEELIRFGENGPIDFEAFCFDHPEWDEVQAGMLAESKEFAAAGNRGYLPIADQPVRPDAPGGRPLPDGWGPSWCRPHRL